MSGLLKFVGQNLAIPNQSIIDAIKCLRIEGMKTALLTNNWKWEDRESDWNMPRYINVLIEVKNQAVLFSL